ncbi:MAG: hypothetical protein U0R24_10590 [Solirubrobacterales bacterium]
MAERPGPRLPRLGVVAWCGLIAALIAVPYVVFEPASTDLAAQTFRADLWREHGWVLWNADWYSGHLVPGYSLIYPPLGALLGPQLVGAISAVAMSVAFAVLVRREVPGRGADLASVWFAVGAGALLYTGRITFLLGFAVALGALLLVHRPPLAALVAGLAACASPVAGLFVALTGAALILAGRLREGLPLAIGASVATLAIIVAFPVGGAQPFGLSSFWWVAVACGLAILVVPPELKALRVGIALYLALLVLVYVVPTPIGSNAPRLGAMLLGPIAALVLYERHPKLLALVFLPLLYWQLAAPVGDYLRGAGDPSTEAAFYEPLLQELEQRVGDEPVRVEVPATRERWEAVHVAERFPLARGWLRQLESGDISDFRDGPLTPEIYRHWLIDHGVSYVALPDATLDYISELEGKLLREDDLPFLKEIWSNDDWKLWEVLPSVRGKGADPSGDPLASKGARVTELGPDGFTVEVPRAGDYLLKMSYTPYFQVTEGDACIRRADAGLARLKVSPEDGDSNPDDPQTIRVDARLSFDGLLGVDSSCSG